VGVLCFTLLAKQLEVLSAISLAGVWVWTLAPTPTPIPNPRLHLHLQASNSYLSSLLGLQLGFVYAYVLQYTD
jgi:hypothetical protein